MSYEAAVKAAALCAAKSGEPVCVGLDFGRGHADGAWIVWAGVNSTRAHLRVYPNGSTVEVPDRTVAEVYGEMEKSGAEAGATIGPGTFTGD